MTMRYWIPVLMSAVLTIQHSPSASARFVSLDDDPAIKLQDAYPHAEWKSYPERMNRLRVAQATPIPLGSNPWAIWKKSDIVPLMIETKDQDWIFSVDIDNGFHDALQNKKTTVPELTLKFYFFTDENLPYQNSRPLSGTLNIDGQLFPAKGTFAVDEVMLSDQVAVSRQLSYTGADAAKLSDRLRSPAQAITFTAEGQTLSVPTGNLSEMFMQIERAYPERYHEPLNWFKN